MRRVIPLLSVLVAASAPLLMAPEGQQGCGGGCRILLRPTPWDFRIAPGVLAGGSVDHQVQVQTGTRYFVEAWAPDSELEVALAPRGASSKLREVECETDRSFTYCEFVSNYRGALDVQLDVSDADADVSLTFGALR